MKAFLDEDFLLESQAAQRLYHDYARDLPIIDFHCHLPPDEIANNRSYETITQIWLGGDHYKWRSMRALGIKEEFISGGATDKEKFDQWAYAVPYTMRNPLYHWTHLELKRYFGIEKLLSPETASEIFDQCNQQLAASEMSVHGIQKKMKVEVVCTTDDPIDSLNHHQRLRDSDYGVAILPTFRPDNILKIDDTTFFKEYVQKLSTISNQEIDNYNDLLTALRSRIDFFHSLGGRLSDHGLDHMYADDFSDQQVDKHFIEAFQGKEIGLEAAEEFRSSMLFHLSQMYHEKGWTQQFHLGALRNTNQRLQRKLGADCGADSINDHRHAPAMARFFNRLDNEDTLAKTIIYNLNPSDNAVFATMIGNYNDGSIAGKMQFGSGWWYLDQKDGMEQQMNALSNMGLLSQFVGMVTDSRSFLSYPRHEYFRRVLCNLIGQDIEKGELPNDMNWLGKIVSDICYHNANNYFGFKLKPALKEI